MNHNPRYNFDCENCKFNWNCGPSCDCALIWGTNDNLPDPPLERKKEVNYARKKGGWTIEFEEVV